MAWHNRNNNIRNGTFKMLSKSRLSTHIDDDNASEQGFVPNRLENLKNINVVFSNSLVRNELRTY